MSSKKKDLPAMPMYWGDWFKAPDVQSLPREVRCLWFEMLGRMWESNERGFLSVNGKPMTDFAKANLFGFGENVEKYRKFERMIEDCGVFSKREDGTIFCRKIVKMVQISEARKQAGSKGGSKTQANKDNLLKQKVKQNTENENEVVDENENENEVETKTQAELEIDELMEFANEQWERHYKIDNNRNRQFLRRILKDYSVDEVRKVILLKAWESKRTRKDGQPVFDRKYLRPETVFNFNKFESYLNDVNDYEKGNYKDNQDRDELLNSKYREWAKQAEQFGI